MAPTLSTKQWVLSHLIVAGLLCLAVLQWWQIGTQPLRFTALNVGQGDALLIQTPEHHTILIDAGPDGTVVDELGKQLGFFDSTIDLFILSHPHRDHYGGIMDVLAKYSVKKVMLTGIQNNDPMYGGFLKTLREKSIPLTFPQADHDLKIGPNLFLDFIFPFKGQNLLGHAFKNKNNSSVVARLVRVGPRGQEPLAILEGDAEQEEETQILRNGADVRAGVLKVGHHGSRTSSTPAYLAAVDPK